MIKMEWQMGMLGGILKEALDLAVTSSDSVQFEFNGVFVTVDETTTWKWGIYGSNKKILKAVGNTTELDLR